MQLEFELLDQTLKRKDQCKPLSNSQGYLKALFKIPPEQTGTITAHFKALHDCVMVEEPMPVIDGRCDIPDSMIRPGTLYVWLSIVTDSTYIPTNSIGVTIYESGDSGNVLPLPDKTTNQYEETLKMYNEIMNLGGSSGSGTVGIDGKSIEYTWLGTSLGIRQEGEQEYQLVDLKGERGEKGEQGLQGLPGIQGIQGIQGERGEQGIPGERGVTGADGYTPIKGVDYFTTKEIEQIKYDVTHKISQETVETKSINPNVYYIWGEVENLTITLEPPTDTSILNEYMFEFRSGATATMLALPVEIDEWVGGTPTVEANKRYICSIVNGLGVMVGA